MTVPENPSWPFVEKPEEWGTGPLDPAPDPSVGAPADPAPPAGGSASELPSAEAPDPSTIDGAFRAYAREQGMADADALLAVVASVPEGTTFKREHTRHEYPWDVQADAEAAAKAALDHLPLSVVASLEHRGLVYHPKIFARLVREGMKLQDLDAQIEHEVQTDPHGTRLKDLLVKRHGRKAKEAQWF